MRSTAFAAAALVIALVAPLHAQPPACSHDAVRALMSADNPRAVRVLVLGNSRQVCPAGIGCAAVRVWGCTAYGTQADCASRLAWEADATGPAAVNAGLLPYRWDASPGRLWVEELATAGQGYPLQLADHGALLVEHAQSKRVDLVLAGYAGNQGEAGTTAAAVEIIDAVLATSPGAAVVLFSDICVPSPSGTTADGTDGCMNLRRSRRWMSATLTALQAEHGAAFPVLALDTLGDDPATPYLPAAMVALRGTDALVGADGVQWFMNNQHPSKAGADAWMLGNLQALHVACAGEASQGAGHGAR